MIACSSRHDNSGTRETENSRGQGSIRTGALGEENITCFVTLLHNKQLFVKKIMKLNNTFCRVQFSQEKKPIHKISIPVTECCPRVCKYNAGATPMSAFPALEGSTRYRAAPVTQSVTV